MAINTVTSTGEEEILDANTEDQLPYLIGAMRERLIICFEYFTVKVGIENGSLAVWDPESGDYLGGRLLLKTATFSEVKEWLDAKVRYYGGSQ